MRLSLEWKDSSLKVSYLKRHEVDSMSLSHFEFSLILLNDVPGFHNLPSVSSLARIEDQDIPPSPANAKLNIDTR